MARQVILGLATVILLIAAAAVGPGEAQERAPAGMFNRMCLIFDRSGSMIGVLDAAWDKVAALARRYRLQPEDELIVVALDNDPKKVYHGPAGSLLRGGRQVLQQLRKVAPSRGTDVISAIEICEDELRRDARPSRLLLWVFSDLHVDPSPTRRFRKPEEYDWGWFRDVEARFFYVDPGKGGSHVRRWRQVLRDRGVQVELLDPLQSEHELYEPVAVRPEGAEGALAVGLVRTAGVALRWGGAGFALMILAGMVVAAFRRARGAGA